MEVLVSLVIIGFKVWRLLQAALMVTIIFLTANARFDCPRCLEN